MKPVPFDYQRPATIDEACQLLAEDSNARILAGGQSLVPMLSMRLSRPSLLVDIAHIPELAKTDDTGTQIEIGAMVRQADALLSPMVRQHIPLLAKALTHVGHPPTRARGTIGGSIAHADPSAEIALTAVTLGADIIYRDAGDGLHTQHHQPAGPGTGYRHRGGRRHRGGGGGSGENGEGHAGA